MSKGSNSTSTESSNTPNPTAMGAYNSLLSQAQSVASTPYQPYTGEEVAPLNSTQQAGVGNISDLASGFQPYAAQAGSNIAGAGAPITAADLSNYYNPYTSQVVNATQADFDTQNARANSTVTGNAAAQGALGGNRVGVAQALTQEGQERVQAPVIAGLQSQGFQQAQQAAQTDKSRQLQAGSAELAGGEQTAQAQVGAGTLAQQTQQSQDTQARADYFQQQGYPFATAQWLASIVLPTGSQMGSSAQSATQGPTPNQWTQAAGLGVTAAAAFARDGGRIQGFAEGGAPNMDVTGGMGWVPAAQVQGHPLATATAPPGKLNDPNSQSGAAGLGGMGAGLGKIGKGLFNKFADSDPNALAGTSDNPLPGLDASDYGVSSMDQEWRGGRVPRRGFAEGGVPEFKGGVESTPYDDYMAWQAPTQRQAYSGDMGALDALNAAAANPPPSSRLPAETLGKWGDLSPQMHQRLNGYANGFRARGGVAGFAGGGVPVSAGFGGGGVEELDYTDLPPIHDTPPSTAADRAADANALRLAGKDAAPDGVAASNAGLLGGEDQPFTKPVKTTSFQRPGVAASSGDEIVPRAMSAFHSIKGGEMPKRALGFASQQPPDDAPDDAPTDVSARGRTPAARSGVAATEQPQSDEKNIFGLPKISDEARQGLISMGLGMMATRRGGPGSFLGGVGEGGEQGMQTYAAARAATAARDAQLRKEAFEREKFNRPYNEMTAEQKAKHGEGRYAIIPGVTTADGSPIERDTHNPNKPPLNAITRQPLTQAEMQSVQQGGWKPYKNMTTEGGDPVLFNSQGHMKNANTQEMIPPGTKLVDSTNAPLAGTSKQVRSAQLAGGDVKSAYSGLTNRAGDNIAKRQIYDDAVNELVTTGGMTPTQAAKYMSDQMQAFAANGVGLSAEARTAGVREANLKIILNVTDAAIPAALEASENVQRLGWRKPNELIQAGQVMTSNKELALFGMANLQLAEGWARAMNPTGVMRESDRDKALHYLSTADNKETYAAVVRQLKKQIDRELGAVQNVKAHGGFDAKVADKDSTADKARAELDAAGGKPTAAAPAAAAKPVPTQADIEYAKANPSVHDKFVKRFGREP